MSSVMLRQTISLISSGSDFICGFLRGKAGICMSSRGSSKDAVSRGAGCPGGAGGRLAGGSLVPLELFTLSYTKYAASLCQVVLLTGHLKKSSKV